MGTGPFALTALTKLWGALEEGDSLCVYTKESKKQGRGMKEQDGCVALFAKEKGLPLYQPRTLRDEAAKEEFLSLEADLAIVASYGLILPAYVLNAPTFGCVNIHASLLPQYRGAAPINRAIINGDTVTGVTIMQMDEGLDTGDMLLKRETVIDEKENCGSLFDRLAEMGAEMLLEILPSIYERTLNPLPQDNTLSTYAAKITKDDQHLDFSLSTKEIYNRIRGLSPIPSAFCYTEKDGKILKIHAAEPSDSQSEGNCGEIVQVKREVLVKTGDGTLRLITVQPEGKGKMDALAAVNGRKLELGDRLL